MRWAATRPIAEARGGTLEQLLTTRGLWLTAMFNKYQAVFRSRWRALLWASGVLLTAYCTVPSPGEEDPATTMAKAVARQHGETQAKPVDPWALDNKAG